ncbi:afadin- and alpha-actinin-binding protein-like isoform X2 [Hemitrygon akajei]|uniref:afadin- and alpha-actinin-binding protein-like isoform X2 n=1 Tax=Hemitrygon akajei TaxID=2704970 RepID=UPI003BF9CBDA
MLHLLALRGKVSKSPKMDHWKTLSFTGAETTPDAKSFVLGHVPQSASPFSAASAITVCRSPVASHQRIFGQCAFCCADNVEDCLLSLSKELSNLGLPSLYTDDSFEESPATDFSLVALINCTYYLLQLHWRDVARIDELESVQLKSFDDQDCLRKSQLKLQEQIEALERELAAVQAKEQQAQRNVHNLNNLLKCNKEEVAKLQNVVASRAAQHIHDLKRKEQELTKLKEKMHLHLTDKRDRRMDILNQIGRSDGRRSLWRTGKTESRREGEMYKVLASNYETQLQQLALDNAELKRAVSHMKKEMSDLLSAQEELCRPSSLQSLLEEDVGLNETQDVDRKHFTDGLLKQWNLLKDHLETRGIAAAKESPVAGEGEHVVSVTDHEKEMAKLKLELEECRQIIQQQQQVLQDQLAIKKEDLAHGPDLLEEMEWFNKERLLFEEQKENFKMEREKFTEAAIRLGYERKLFEQECAQFRKEQFLNLTPFRECRTKPSQRLRTPRAMTSPDRGNVPLLPTRRRMGTWTMHSRHPSRTPSPSAKDTNSRRYSLPTTHDLYKALGMTPEQSLRKATVARLKRSCSARLSPSLRRDSATQTRKDLGWIRSALLMNEPDDSLYIRDLHTPV